MVKHQTKGNTRDYYHLYQKYRSKYLMMGGESYKPGMPGAPEIDFSTPVLLYYTCYSNKELLNSNKDLFKAIYHYNHIYINPLDPGEPSEMKLNISVVYDNITSVINILFEN